MLQLELTDQTGTLTDMEWAAAVAAAGPVLARAQAGEARYADSLGWLDPTVWGGQDWAERAAALAQKLHSFADTFVVIGVGGEIIDAQMGLTMAQVYDSGSQINMTVTASLLHVLLVLVFFAENGHYTLVRIFLTSGEVLPFGQATFGQAVASGVVEVFLSSMLLAVKLAFPILAAELLGELGMGILMKAIPQINAFVINIELKVIIGLVLLFLFLTPMSEFLLAAEGEMLDGMSRMLTILGTPG